MNCPICKSRRTKVFKTIKKENIMICKRCRHIFFEKPPEGHELANYYENQYAQAHAQVMIQTDISQVAYYQRHLEELLLYAGSDREKITIADYGCAYPSFLSVAAARKGIRAVGIEFDLDARKAGLEKDIEMYSPEEFFSEYPVESIDIMRFSHALEHCADPLDVIKKCTAKIRKGGGIVYITQPDFPVFYHGHGTEIQLKDCIYPEHLHFFNIYSLITMVESAGLAIEKVFSHTNETGVWEKLKDKIDLDFSRKKLWDYQKYGDGFFSKYANFPYYCGENSFLIARRK